MLTGFPSSNDRRTGGGLYVSQLPLIGYIFQKEEKKNTYLVYKTLRGVTNSLEENLQMRRYQTLHCMKYWRRHWVETAIGFDHWAE